MLKIRRSCNRLIFNMGISIPEKDGLYIETEPSGKYVIFEIVIKFENETP